MHTYINCLIDRLSELFFFYYLKDSENTEKVRSLDEHRKLFTNVWIDFLQLKVWCHYSDRINTKIHNWNCKRPFDKLSCLFYYVFRSIHFVFLCVCSYLILCTRKCWRFSMRRWCPTWPIRCISVTSLQRPMM